MKETDPSPAVIHRRLLAWYGRHGRDLPWRVKSGRADPYRVWLSEIMLQQTTVPAVIPYFAKFTTRWPDVRALAAAPLDDLLSAWAGLGYYARARNLHACARAVVERHGAQFPRQADDLLALPGIGPYTAAAIAAIAFDDPAMPVDGNIERVTARLFAVTDPMPASKPKLRQLAETLTPQKRPGDFAQALMDLGATICTPRSPKCGTCPLSDGCKARAKGIASDLPARAPKVQRPTRHGIVFLMSCSDELLLRKRPEKGLLGGMTEIPSTEWRAAPWSAAEWQSVAPLKAGWHSGPGGIEHVFTHFRLLLEIVQAEVPSRSKAAIARATGGTWHHRRDLHRLALPSVMTKVLKAADRKR